MVGNLIYFTFFSNKRVIGRKYKVGVALAGISLLASLPFFLNYLLYGHDLYFHLMRIVSAGEGMGNGQFPVRIATNMLNDYGYATPLFYSDFFLYLPALLYQCMVPLRTCYQVYVIGINIVTVGIAFYSFNKMVKDDKLALLGTLLYTVSAYRLTNVLTRAAVGEYTAMMFLPLIVLGMYSIYRCEKPKWSDWSPLAFGMSGIILSHILTVQMVVIFLGITVLLLFKKTFAKERIVSLIKAIFLTIGLTAWYVLPMVQSMKMPVKVFNGGVNPIQEHGLYFMQLFGMFTPTTGGTTPNSMTGEMPLSLGVSLVAGVLIILYAYLNRHKMDQKTYKPLNITFGLSCIAMVFTLRSFPWGYAQNWFGGGIAQFCLHCL